MHTLTDAIQQHSDAIKRRLDEASVNLTQHLERAQRRYIARMALLIAAAVALAAALYVAR